MLIPGAAAPNDRVVGRRQRGTTARLLSRRRSCRFV